jgi:hypothetical protein
MIVFSISFGALPLYIGTVMGSVVLYIGVSFFVRFWAFFFLFTFVVGVLSFQRRRAYQFRRSCTDRVLICVFFSGFVQHWQCIS